MTTTSQPVPNLEASNADDMDLHSDIAFDIGDIDFGSATGTKPQEDDVLSLQDADPNAGLDTYYGDVHDDPMIEEDDDTFHRDENADIELADAEQPPVTAQDTHSMTSAGAAASLPAGSVANPPEEAVEEKGDVDEEITWDDDELSTAHISEDQGVDYEDEATLPQSTPHVQDLSAPQDDLVGTQESIKSTEQPTGIEQGEDLAANIEFGDPEYENVPYGDGEIHDLDQHDGTESDTAHLQGSIADREDGVAVADDGQQDHQDNMQAILHQVTVNYDGTEFWMFKPSGDENEWLLTDTSLASQPLHSLLRALRDQLGSDLDSEVELGFRFDHFYNLEVFEDSTACAYTTLIELVRIYLSLCAQDGSNDPESFYVTLQFRPRVLALVNELKKAVQEEKGYERMSNDVSAGNTRFNTIFSNNDSEGNLNQSWEEKNQDDEQGEDNVEVHHQEDQNEEDDAEDVSYYDDQYEDAGNVEQENNETNSAPNSAVQTTDSVAHPPVKTPATSSAETPATSTQPNEDYIDYTDDENDAEEAVAENDHTAQVSGNEHSTASSTLQGDDASYSATDGHDPTHATETGDQGSQYAGTLGEGDELGQVSTAEYHHDTHQGEHDESYYEDSAYNDGLDGRFGDVEFAPDFDNEAFASQDVEKDDDPTLVEQNDDATALNADDAFELTTAIEDNIEFNFDDEFAEVSNSNDGNAVVDDFLDLDADQVLQDGPDKLHHNDNDLDIQAHVDASFGRADADSSFGILEPGSPQGQKRPIDEVDTTVDSVDDSADTKRPKL